VHPIHAGARIPGLDWLEDHALETLPGWRVRWLHAQGSVALTSSLPRWDQDYLDFYLGWEGSSVHRVWCCLDGHPREVMLEVCQQKLLSCS